MDLQRMSRTEWLEADGLGGFASGTVAGIRTRRYQALLLTAMTPPTNRVVLINGYDAWAETSAGVYALSAQRYTPDVIHPDGAQRIELFEPHPWPRWIYRLEDGTRIEHELFVPHGSSMAVLSWRLRKATSHVTLVLRPFFSGRDYHALHHENPAFQFVPDGAPSRLTWHPYPNLPRVMTISNGSYRHQPEWYRNVLYVEERTRGLDETEDLASPGEFRWDVSAREAVWIVAAEEHVEKPPDQFIDVEHYAKSLRMAEQQRRRAFSTPLHLAADAYIVSTEPRRVTNGSEEQAENKPGKTIIAGYPWFTDWGRDTFIAIRGLCLAIGRLDLARDILLEWAGTVSEGMVPNRFPDRGSGPEFNSVDASLWYVIAIHEFLQAAEKKTQQVAPEDRAILCQAVESILDGYANGTRFGIHLDTDGLLAAGQPGTQLTWMDAKIGEWVVTPRIGKPVEVQALWLNALKIGSLLSDAWNEPFHRGMAAFEARFWNESSGSLYDVVDCDHRPGTVDASCRPNQIFAVGGLPFPLLQGTRARQVVDVVAQRLWTPMGLRSLAPGEPAYVSQYHGGVRERDGAYHQGTVWPWLAGPFIEAWVRVHGVALDVKKMARERYLNPLLQQVHEEGLGHLPEIADADPPHTPRGCPFQAWSLGEAMRVLFDVLWTISKISDSTYGVARERKVMMKPTDRLTAEAQRLEESAGRKKHWKRWGPYLSERAWGTVREDYSPDGTAWEYFPHDHARSRAYRWNEDGLAGISDRHQFICFALALWNGRDPILKERLFGLTGNEGNHGEDVKEYYFYLDSTPTHSYMKYLYKYPHTEFPYARLVEENRRRERRDPEFELMDTGVFDQDRYFDVFVEYAKATSDDLLIRIEIVNRGPEPAELTVLPTMWFRNTWSWGLDVRRPRLRQGDSLSAGGHDVSVIELTHDYYGRRCLFCEGGPALLFTENETNAQRLYHSENTSPYVKDGINDYIVHGRKEAVNSLQIGSKAAAQYVVTIESEGTHTIQLRLTDREAKDAPFGKAFDQTFAQRRLEADEFYRELEPDGLSEDARRVQRQSFAGLLWSKQFYHYEVSRWLRGDPGQPDPPQRRLHGRNSDWSHLYNADVISMPDKWEYPWYAAWDLAFHCVPLALIDPAMAKEQLILLVREWYMHPNGQLPAYEWALGDVNPPVHAWAAWRVYKIEKKRRGVGDRRFLERVFQKLLLNFTWWVNRKDADGRNIFQGGFLGLDNIGVFDRSKPLPTGGHIEQSDATSWMGMYCLNMLVIAMELARENNAYEDMASKFFEHFVYICRAINKIGQEELELWNKEDGFFYDVLHLPDGRNLPLKVRSMVGLIPLFAVETLDSELVDQLPRFKHRMQWFIENRPEFGSHVETLSHDNGVRRFLSLVSYQRLRRVLHYMLDEHEFLSPYGIRALSQFHRAHPYTLSAMGMEYRVDYEPAESSTGLFGGNSNWRGPIWFPVNYLIIESLQKFHYFLGEEYKVECPVGSNRHMHLGDVANELSRRLTHLFLRGPDGRRPVFGGMEKFQQDPHWRDLLLFYEYFHGDNGAGIGASHQTGWTGLVAKCIDMLARGGTKT